MTTDDRSIELPEAPAHLVPGSMPVKQLSGASPEICLRDRVDEEAFDLFLYERYQLHHLEMIVTLRTWLDVAADTAAERGIPTVSGEGWIGYTPLSSHFEDGPIGAAFCRRAVEESVRIRAWRTIVCSNAAA